MLSFIEYFLHKTRLTLLIFVSMIIIGTSSYNAIPKEENPSITIPIISVQVSYPGLSNEDSEKFIVRPLETALKNIDNLKKIESYAGNNYGLVRLEFNAGFDSSKALADVREKVNQAKRDLPEDASEPVIKEVDLSRFPVLNVILYGDIPERAMYHIADHLEQKILQINDVLQVDKVGFRNEIIDITIKPEYFYAYRINPSIIGNNISSNMNFLLAGKIDKEDMSANIRIPSPVQDYTEILKLPLIVWNNKMLRLNDIVEIRRSYDDRSSFARINNKQTFVLEVAKRSGSNLIETVDQIRNIVEMEKPNLPENLTIIYANDSSQMIKDSINELGNNIIIASLAAILPVIFTMGLKSSLLISIAIPGSFLIGISAIHFMNYTMNIIVLFSLILSIGMLVDAAIVICEYADREMIKGKDPKEAYISATKRMFAPMLASTAANTIVFVPLLFWPGITGQFMKYLPITMIIVLSASLIMAFIFIPVIGYLCHRKKKYDHKFIAQVIASEEGDLDQLNPLTKKYVYLLDKILDKPGKFCLVNIALLLVVYLAYFIFGKGIEFFPNVEPSNIGISIHAIGNYSLDQKDKVIASVEDRISDLIGKDYKLQYASSRGSSKRGGISDIIGNITMELKHWTERRQAEDIIKDILNRTKDIEGIEIQTMKDRAGPSQGKPLSINISAKDKIQAQKIFSEIKNKVSSMGSFINIEHNFDLPIIEWIIKIDQDQLAMHDVSAKQISDLIQMITQGIVLTKMRLNDVDEEIDIRMRFDKANRLIHNLNFFGINIKDGTIPFTNLAKIIPSFQQNNIYRLNGAATLYISADVAPGVIFNNELNILKQWISEQNYPQNVSITFSGDEEEKTETTEFLAISFYLAILGILIIFLIEFDSFYYSFVIMSAIIFSTAGVLLALIITMRPFSIVMCGLGIIALAGTVVNHNIVYIDTFIKLDKKIPIRERLLIAGAQRIRPILLTSLTCILGLLPMVLKLNIDIFNFSITYNAPSTQWWTQLSTAIVGGMSLATILTLFATPALILFGNNLKKQYIAIKNNFIAKF